jgi:hypothetical protein
VAPQIRLCCQVRVLLSPLQYVCGITSNLLIMRTTLAICTFDSATSLYQLYCMSSRVL